MIKLSLKIIVYIIDPTSKKQPCHRSDDKKFQNDSRSRWSITSWMLISKPSEVSTSGNESELAVGSAGPWIKPRIGTVKAFICLGWEILKMDKFLIFALKKIDGY